jgi:hypothetical protein
MLYCYNDKHSGWGAKLHELAKQRGMRSKMLVSHEQLPLSLQESALFFCRVEQFPPAHDPSKKFCLDVLA